MILNIFAPDQGRIRVFGGAMSDALWVRVVTYFPLVTPFLMVNRLASAIPPGPAEIVASMALIVASTLAALWLAGRVFRTAILLYGKPATPRELWRWMRTG